MFKEHTGDSEEGQLEVGILIEVMPEMSLKA